MQHLDLELTRRCNLKCEYCYLADAPRDATMSRDTVDMSLELLRRFGKPPKKKKLRVNLYGGEPLLVFDKVQEVIELAKSKAMDVTFTVVSNGTIASEAMASYLRDNNAGVTRSLDGCPSALAFNRPNILPAYKRATEVFKDYNKTRRSTVAPAAAKTVLESVRFFKELGFPKGGVLMPDFYPEWTDEQEQDFLDQLWAVGEEFVKDTKEGHPFYFYWFNREGHRFKLGEKTTPRPGPGFGCGAGNSLVAVNCHGYIYTCHRFCTEPTEGDFCSGHLEEILSDKRKLQFGPTWQEWLKFQGRKDSPPQCDTCISQIGCSGNCAHVNYKVCGRVDEPAPFFCRIKQESSKIVAWIDSQLRHTHPDWHLRPNQQAAKQEKAQEKKPEEPKPAPTPKKRRRRNVVRRIADWRESVKRWKEAGKPERSIEEVERIVRECCEPCNHYNTRRKQCSLCGCFCRRAGHAEFNKPVMLTERCPLDPPKWGGDAVSKPPSSLLQVQFTTPMDVVYPISGGFHGKKRLGSKWDNNELRYSLRSLEQHFTSMARVFVIGHMPDWLTNVIHIPAEDAHRHNKDANIIDKVLLACRSGVSPTFLRLSDDQCLLRDWDGLEARHAGDAPFGSDGSWWKRMRRTCDYLRGEGRPAFFYDTHSPAPVDRDTFIKVVTEANYQPPPGMCINTLYFNSIAIPREHMNGQKVAVHKPRTLDRIRKAVRGKTFFGYGERGLNDDVKRFLQERFPSPSKYEI